MATMADEQKSSEQEAVVTLQASSGANGSSHKVDIHTVNPGNPVFSCDKRFTKHASNLVTEPKTQEKATNIQHPMYMTSSNTYGSLVPSAETCPSTFHGKSQKFSEHLARAGNYRNNSFNTSCERNGVM
ncbi:PREDICTED: UPF0691 protein C9orf116 homolog [Amphimedon queenslandica]|uniref:Uncharacterized protein n=1 Tax=Amphimedon queenslandica TaxID=400682 RepID=A0A1X7UW82_AMPQE|nr:PREDICTED: UPF0691 protein C9orf116 homolog [Amphimedon queenslandica]|eukprot:XP_011403925.1 PREDICTED: UPF0691 protein C9orf116 homolog [Amphimedon queenslandica]